MKQPRIYKELLNLKSIIENPSIQFADIAAAHGYSLNTLKTLYSLACKVEATQ